MPLNDERQVTAERVGLRIGALETHFEQPDVDFSGSSEVVRQTPLDNGVGTVVQPLTAGPLEVTVTGTGFTDEVAELERLRRLQNRPDTRPDSFVFPIQMRHWLYSGSVVVEAVDGNTVPGLGSVDGDGEWKSLCEFVVSVVETDE
jgi:hypothetical protein